jgi:two-component system, LuxR family, response regulator FixJ
MLRDDQRGVIGQHDAAGPDPDAAGAAGHIADHHRGRRTGNADHVVMLGEPEAAVSEALGMTRQVEGISQGVGRARAFGNKGEIEDREGHLPAYGCLLIDCFMPGMSGLELLDEVRSRGVTLPAILITGHPSPTLRKRAVDTGIPLIEKPLLGNGLVETIRCAIAKHGKPGG